MTAEREHHHPALFDEKRWAVGATIALYTLAAMVMIWMALGRSTLQPLDDWFHDSMVSIESGALTFLAKVFNYLGSTWVTLPLRVGVAWLLWAQKRWEWFTVWLASIAVAEVSVTVFKLLYDRPRPIDPLVSTTGASFPSGHAMAGAVTAVALVIVFLPAGPHRRIWELVAVGFAFFMAMSRTYLRAHWLTDVVAGVLLGAAAAVGVAAIVHVWWLRNRGAAEVAAMLDDHRHQLGALASGSAVFVASAALAWDDNVPALEESAFEFINGWPDWIAWPLYPVMQFGMVVAPFVAGAVAWYLTRKRQPALALVSTGFGMWVLAKIVKAMVDRPRPGGLDLEKAISYRIDGGPDGLGFISGHAAVGFVIAVIASPYVGKRWAAVLWALATGAATLRVYVGAHLPLDSVGGAGLGIAAGAAALLVIRRR